MKKARIRKNTHLGPKLGVQRSLGHFPLFLPSFSLPVVVYFVVYGLYIK